MLEDGSVWPGFSFGAKGTEIGEVVFNTSLTGNNEIPAPHRHPPPCGLPTDIKPLSLLNRL